MGVGVGGNGEIESRVQESRRRDAQCAPRLTDGSSTLSVDQTEEVRNSHCGPLHEATDGGVADWTDKVSCVDYSSDGGDLVSSEHYFLRPLSFQEQGPSKYQAGQLSRVTVCQAADPSKGQTIVGRPQQIHPETQNDPAPPTVRGTERISGCRDCGDTPESDRWQLRFPSSRLAFDGEHQHPLLLSRGDSELSVDICRASPPSPPFPKPTISASAPAHPPVPSSLSPVAQPDQKVARPASRTGRNFVVLARTGRSQVPLLRPSSPLRHIDIGNLASCLSSPASLR